MARWRTEMRAFWRALGRIFFWSYERMTWQYDVMVALIVLFVLLTPRHWFRDQPRARIAASANVQLVSEDAASHTTIYRLDAGALPPDQRSANRTPELDRRAHDILGGTVADLKGSSFQIVRVQPKLASDGSVEYYDVTVQR
jgi:hypothetical protein